MKSNYDYKRVNNDVNGNPRYVFHFLHFVNDNDEKKAELLSEQTKPFTFTIEHLYNIALQKCRIIGGKKYKGKDFGGGIVFQSYNVQSEIIDKIADIKNS